MLEKWYNSLEVQVMKKKDIVDAIFQNSDYFKQDIDNVVTQVFELLTKGLELEDKVMISNFGTFEKVLQEDYYGVNPITGERQLIKGGYRIRFTSSKHLKDCINKK
jgi:nucleoid DNA-binding protein